MLMCYYSNIDIFYHDFIYRGASSGECGGIWNENSYRNTTKVVSK